MSTNMPVAEIRVGSKVYPGTNWREALDYHMHGIWGNLPDVMNHPVIDFGSISIGYFKALDTYVAYWSKEGGKTEYPRIFVPEQILEASRNPLAFHDGLMRFSRNNVISMLVVWFADHGRVNLWKGNKRGMLYISASAIPDMEELREFYPLYFDQQ